jgi:nucleotide-binding universal stress UspA family protein
MFEHILVPLDGSSLAECVLPHLVAIARAYNSQVSLLRVLDPARVTTRPQLVDPFDWQIRKTEAETYLREKALALEAEQIHPRIEVLEGKAAETAIEYANSHDVSLIIMSSHGQSGITGWNVSSVVQKIILRAQTSFMVIRAYRPPIQAIGGLQYRRILVPLDGSQRAEIVLPAAITLARAHEGEVLIAHVIRKPEMPSRTPPCPEDVRLANQVVERNRREVTRYLDEFKFRRDVNIDVRLSVGENIPASLHEIVNQSNVDLVCVSAHGYSGETRWPFGSSVFSLIAFGTTPLLVVQDLPAGRIDPTGAELAAMEQGGR